jgi:hypothetical protein
VYDLPKRTIAAINGSIIPPGNKTKRRNTISRQGKGAIVGDHKDVKLTPEQQAQVDADYPPCLSNASKQEKKARVERMMTAQKACLIKNVAKLELELEHEKRKRQFQLQFKQSLKSSGYFARYFCLRLADDPADDLDHADAIKALRDSSTDEEMTESKEQVDTTSSIAITGDSNRADAPNK